MEESWTHLVWGCRGHPAGTTCRLEHSLHLTASSSTRLTLDGQNGICTEMRFQALFSGSAGGRRTSSQVQVCSWDQSPQRHKALGGAELPPTAPDNQSNVTEAEGRSQAQQEHKKQENLLGSDGELANCIIQSWSRRLTRVSRQDRVSSFQASAPGNTSENWRVGLLQLSSFGLGSGALCAIPTSLQPF